MGIVIAVATYNRVVVKSDGFIEDKNHNCYEDYEKMYLLNEQCMIGTLGSKELCENLINEYKNLALSQNIDLTTLQPTTVIYDLCELLKVMNEENEDISIFVTGKEKDNIVLFGFTSYDNYEIYNFSPDDEKSTKYIVFGSEIQKKGMDFSKFYRADVSIETTMNNYIRYVKSIDSNVNDHIFTRKMNR